MDMKWNQIKQKVLSKLLVLFGFSCTFVFMACYGPAPTEYEPIDEADVEESFVSDSITVADAPVVKEVTAE